MANQKQTAGLAVIVKKPGSSTNIHYNQSQNIMAQPLFSLKNMLTVPPPINPIQCTECENCSGLF